MKVFTIFFYALFTLTFSVNAQLASYSFNSYANDQLGDYNPSSITGSPDYSSGEYVLLDSGEYIVLPEALNSAFDNTASLEIELRFKVEGDWQATEAIDGFGEEARVLISSKNEYDQRVGGFDITARQWEGSLWIITTFGDGIVDENGSLSEGKLDFVAEIDSDIWYDFSMKILFEEDTPSIQYIVNGSSSVSYFDDRLDYDGFRQTVPQQQLILGSTPDNNISERDAMHPSMDLKVDYLTFSSPAAGGNSAVVGSTLQTLIDHMNGSISLNSDELDAEKASFVANWDDDSYDANRSVVDEYISTYSNKNSYVFTLQYNAEDPANFSVLKSIQYQIQQWILDNKYNSSTVGDMSGVSFKDHEQFPGSVSSSASRLSAATFTIDGDYNTNPGFYLNDQEYVRRPTGFFAPAGELITITVPDEAVGQGLTVYVGAHRKNLQETWTEFRRFPRTSTSFLLDAETVTVANPFGGGIYIAIPDGKNLGVLTFSIDGAVKAPYYCTKEGFANSLTEFMEEIQKAEVPYVDMESANFMTTITHGMASEMTNPDSVLAIWDRSFDAINMALGRPQARFRSEYIIQDRQTHVKFTGAPAAYPMSLEVYDYPYDKVSQQPVDVESGREWYNGSVSNTFNRVIFHEYGHLHNMPTLAFEQETNVHIPAAVVYSEVMGESIDSAFVYALVQRLNLEQATFDWIFTSNFINGERIGYEPNNPWDQLLYQSRGLVKLVDIAKMFGWEALGEINNYFYQHKIENPDWDPYGLGDDELIRAASEVMGFNMAPHFEFHGIIPSDELVEELEDLPTSDIIKDRILHYRFRVPKNNAEFMEVYNEVVHKLDPTFHVPRWDGWSTEYDEEYAVNIIGRIDEVLSRYYTLTEEDFNFNPAIVGLVEPIIIPENTSITLTLDDLIVEDLDHTYPDDFALTVLEGENYILNENTISPTSGFVGELEVPVKVSDGIEESELYMISIIVERVLNAEAGVINQFLIYPNPTADGAILLEGIGYNTRYRITNAAGKIVNSGIVEDGSLKIDGKSGLYFLWLLSPDQEVRRAKIMKG